MLQDKKLSLNAKLLAWSIFLFYFIENGTLGIIPKQFYYVYRNVRISDLILYGLVAYAFFNIKEYRKLFYSQAMIIPKILLMYIGIQFIVSAILYQYNPIELFFRLKGLWMSFLIFPFLLLFERKALGYLIKLILPVTVISNILYILSSLTGTPFLPDIGIAEQNLPGGLKVYRVFGGTFFGELFFLGFIYTWITDRFRLYQLGLVLLFVLPHILAFGRSAWIFFSMTIVIMLLWYAFRKKDIRLVVRQIVIIGFLAGIIFYTFSEFIPESDYMFNAIEARVSQGRDDWKYGEGTLGSRMANIVALLDLWQDGNIFFGIGMHPMWVIAPVTAEESIYAWGFSDVGWAGLLTAYGLTGFTLAVIFQLFFIIRSFKLIKSAKYYDIMTFFTLYCLSKLFFDSVISYSIRGFSVGLWGFSSVVLLIACVIYKFEYPDKPYKI